MPPAPNSSGSSTMIIGAIIVLVLLIAGFFVWQAGGKTATLAGGTGQMMQQVATSTYATSTFSITYPQDYTADKSYAYGGVPKKPIHGVKFVIPLTMATGTNLAADSGVSVEQLPRAKHCTGDIYLYENTRPQQVTDAGVEYSVATTSGAAAGNLYEEQVWALTGSRPCTALRYFIHSTNIGNYSPGAVTAFDRAALLQSFDTIRESLRLNQ